MRAALRHVRTSMPLHIYCAAGMLDFVGKAKWQAWRDLGDMGQEAAQIKYAPGCRTPYTRCMLCVQRHASPFHATLHYVAAGTCRWRKPWVCA